MLNSFRNRSLAAFAAICATSAAFAASASAATTPGGLPAPTASCSSPMLASPFANIGDGNLYTLAPGEAADNFSATGWTLTGGAHLVQTTLSDHATGEVLDLPSGATAESPVMCVAADYPDARMLVRDVAGAPGQGVNFAVAYGGVPQVTGRVHVNPLGWSASQTVNVAPSTATGWQYVRFILTANSTGAEYQIYNFYVDPRCMGA